MGFGRFFICRDRTGGGWQRTTRPRITGRSGLNFKSAEAASSQGSFHAGFGLMGIPASQAPARNMPYFV